MSESIHDAIEAVRTAAGQLVVDHRNILGSSIYGAHQRIRSHIEKLERDNAALLAACQRLVAWSPADENGYCRFCNQSLHSHDASCDLITATIAIAQAQQPQPQEPSSGN